MRVESWRGSFELGDGWAVWRGAVGDGSPHRHLAAQAVLASEPITVFDAAGRCVRARCILIDPLVTHRLDCAQAAELIFVEPWGRDDPSLRQRLDPIREAEPALLLGPTAYWAGWRTMAGPKEDNDPRVLAALRTIDAALQDGPLPLSTVARTSGLSAERFRRVFAHEVGLPYSRYLPWRRLRLAAVELMAGRDATTAAHAAGFADAAHFARTLKTMFGVTASQTLLDRRDRNGAPSCAQ